MRPTRLDDLVSKRICDAVAKGLPRRTAAKLAGVAPSSLFLWLRKGRDGDPAYSDFSERIAAAEAKGEDELMGLMREHAKTSVAACTWLLSVRNPKAYTLKRPAAEPEKPAAHTRFAGMSDEAFAAEARRIRQQMEESMGTEELTMTVERLKTRLAGKVGT
jgi:hypothetical protein